MRWGHIWWSAVLFYHRRTRIVAIQSGQASHALHIAGPWSAARSNTVTVHAYPIWTATIHTHSIGKSIGSAHAGIWIKGDGFKTESKGMVLKHINFFLYIINNILITYPFHNEHLRMVHTLDLDTSILSLSTFKCI